MDIKEPTGTRGDRTLTLPCPSNTSCHDCFQQRFFHRETPSFSRLSLLDEGASRSEWLNPFDTVKYGWKRKLAGSAAYEAIARFRPSSQPVSRVPRAVMCYEVTISFRGTLGRDTYTEMTG